jgi:hypothetical protein
MELPNYPEIFVCVGMVVGLYGVVYLEIARRPERGFVLALVGFVRVKFWDRSASSTTFFLVEWTYASLIMNLTNDFIWLIPFGIYLLDSWPYFKKDLYERD